jgi:hypothetical protein
METHMTLILFLMPFAVVLFGFLAFRREEKDADIFY